MKKMSEIMKELGFDENGSEDVKKAFIKNLIKTVNYQENGADVLPIKEELKAGSHLPDLKSENKAKSRMEQLSFQLDDDKKLA
jgi:hypothetical protein